MTSASALSFVAGCGKGDDGFALQARGGTYVDGSGRLGTVLLATLRDGSGAGPATTWSGSLSGPIGAVGGTVTYQSPGAGSWVAVWWPEEPSYAGAYSLALAQDGGDAASAGFTIGDGTGIAPPQPVVEATGATVSWTPVPGASAYECRVSGEGGVALNSLVSATSCDLGALAPGSYTASVLAYSADVVAIAASDSREPALPERFDVSEARFAFDRIDSGTPIAVLAAAGGGFRDGTVWSGSGLAVWASILNADGTPTAVPWSVEVVGPGLTAAAPLGFTYPANFSRIMVWSEAVPARPGSYGLVARSSLGSIARPFTVGTLATIDAPTGVVATSGSLGSAKVDWAAVAGAVSYLVTARHGVSQHFVMSQWVSAPTAQFPDGTFVAGEPYDVYVAATDADMVSGAGPTQFAITENSFQPGSFVGR